MPKGLLKSWVGREGSEVGIHYVDLSTGAVRFEKGREACFAITNYIYVPERINGERDDALEDWFSVDENGLAVFSQQAAAGTLGSFTNEKLISQAIRACIALGNRSAYSMFMAISATEAADRSPHEFAVANILRSCSQKFRAFSAWDFRVLYDLPVPLLISERPFLDFTPRGQDMVVMALGPRAILMGTPSGDPKRPQMSLGVCPATPEHSRVAIMHNFATKEMARQWVVASSRSELEAMLPQLTPEKVLERRKTDRVIVGTASGSRP
ncbi:hypothetical protein [Rhizobium leguminosarum]|uniref:hypothetical protein n=1 Tax=Rhizobium leguminosarum TaxID=384 RepID=UPI001C909A89|nr:hypothetical protein [Rhizobium leguminosarum]MBY3044848.1 DUF4238 domain-containing protein [Rhizobium leguminosarum]